MEIWYTIEKNNNKWTVWKNTMIWNKTHGCGGCKGIFSSTSRKDCIEYCKENNLKVSRAK